jgi:hypothetical protein
MRWRSAEHRPKVGKLAVDNVEFAVDGRRVRAGRLSFSRWMASNFF